MLIGPQLPRRGSMVPCEERSRARRLRLNKLLEIFKAYTFVSSLDAAHALNVTPRTVLDDVAALRQAGHRIDGERGYGLMYRGSSAAPSPVYRPARPENVTPEIKRRRQRIAEYITNSRTTTAQDLAVYFQKTERTIYRDVEALKSSGVPIVGEAGRGYSIERHA